MCLARKGGRLTIVYGTKSTISEFFVWIKIVGGFLKLGVAKEMNSKVGTSHLRTYCWRWMRRGVWRSQGWGHIFILFALLIDTEDYTHNYNHGYSSCASTWIKRSAKKLRLMTKMQKCCDTLQMGGQVKDENGCMHYLFQPAATNPFSDLQQ